MAAKRALRRFPFNLNLGTDICHVVRIRGILESSRGVRFIQKILTQEERGHPKIRRILEDRSAHEESIGESLHVASPGFVKPNSGKTTPRLPSGPSTHELQAAATFMAGRYAHRRSTPRNNVNIIGHPFSSNLIAHPCKQAIRAKSGFVISPGSRRRKPSSKLIRRGTLPGMISQYHTRPRRTKIERAPRRL